MGSQHRYRVYAQNKITGERSENVGIADSLFVMNLLDAAKYCYELNKLRPDFVHHFQVEHFITPASPELEDDNDDWDEEELTA